MDKERLMQTGQYRAAMAETRPVGDKPARYPLWNKKACKEPPAYTHEEAHQRALRIARNDPNALPACMADRSCDWYADDKLTLRPDQVRYFSEDQYESDGLTVRPYFIEARATARAELDALIVARSILKQTIVVHESDLVETKQTDVGR